MWPPASARVRIFVYGTLRRGEPNHRLLASATYLGPAHTEPHFRLYDLGPYPCLVGGGGDAVEGEVYEVGLALLRRLDRFEGHPTLYRREGLRLREAPPAQGYVWAGALPAHARPVAGGRWCAAGARAESDRDGERLPSRGRYAVDSRPLHGLVGLARA